MYGKTGPWVVSPFRAHPARDRRMSPIPPSLLVSTGTTLLLEPIFPVRQTLSVCQDLWLEDWADQERNDRSRGRGEEEIQSPSSIVLSPQHTIVRLRFYEDREQAQGQGIGPCCFARRRSGSFSSSS